MKIAFTVPKAEKFEDREDCKNYVYSNLTGIKYSYLKLEGLYGLYNLEFGILGFTLDIRWKI